MSRVIYPSSKKILNDETIKLDPSKQDSKQQFITHPFHTLVKCSHVIPNSPINDHFGNYVNSPSRINLATSLTMLRAYKSIATSECSKRT